VLGRLLDISHELPIDSWELTPVQVWHQIKQDVNFNRINVDHLTSLSDKLLDHMKCYGYVQTCLCSCIKLTPGSRVRFGAVVRQDYLKKLLSSTVS